MSMSMQFNDEFCAKLRLGRGGKYYQSKLLFTDDRVDQKLYRNALIFEIVILK